MQNDPRLVLHEAAPLGLFSVGRNALGLVAVHLNNAALLPLAGSMLSAFELRSMPIDTDL